MDSSIGSSSSHMAETQMNLRPMVWAIMVTVSLAIAAAVTWALMHVLQAQTLP